MNQDKKPYDIATPELIAKAQELVNRNAKYSNLKKQLAKYEQQGNYIGIMHTRQLMDAAMKAVVTELVEKEIEERKSTKAILEMLPDDEKGKYRDLLNALCFCFDTIDYIITDVNDLLKRNRTGFNVDSIHEIKKCKEKVSSVLNTEIREMNEEEQNIYTDEADGIYAYLLKRARIFRKKTDKLAKK